MLRTRAGSWILALAIVAAPALLCGRAAAQEPPATAPEQQPEASAEGPAARVQRAPGENRAPDPTAKRSPRAGDVQKVFVLKNVNARSLAAVLGVFPATITFSSYERTSALGVSAPPAVMAAIEETIKRLDVPRPSFRNIELTGEVLEALPAPAETTSPPPALQEVVAQLRRTFGFAAYRLADTLFVRSREEEGFATAGTSASEFLGLGRLKYRLMVRTAFITAATAGPLVHLDRLVFTVDNEKLGHGSIEASGIDIHDGQRVVVGNSGLGAPGSAIILVLSAKVVD